MINELKKKCYKMNKVKLINLSNKKKNLQPRTDSLSIFTIYTYVLYFLIKLTPMSPKYLIY